MEPAKIDWKRLEWKFVEDELYENINAPKWVDLLASDESVDDEAWFCKPDCKHPKTVDDFLRSTPSKLFSPVKVLEALPLRDQDKRDAKLKKRLPALSSASSASKLKFNQDSENQNPSMSTPTKNPLKPMKAAIKSSEEKKKPIDDTSQSYKAHPLKSTLSAKNLFAGRPILNQITEFCNELKKLATGARERVNTENLSARKSEEGVKEKMASAPKPLGELDKREKERKPLLEVGKTQRSEGGSNKVKQQRNIIRPDEAENMPISLDLENARCKKEESLLQIRTNPPSPQCFSANCGPNKTTPSKASKSRLMERGILQEVEQNKEVAKESFVENSRSIATMDAREGRALDVLWFLKPCTISG